MNYPRLFSQGRIGKLNLKNRIVMTAMETDMAEFDGTPSPLLVEYFRQRAAGGAGLIITGITRVNDMHGVSTPRQLALSRNRHVKPMKGLTDAVHREGAAIFCQLHHPGRQTYAAMVNVWPLMGFAGRRIPGFSRLFPGLVRFYRGMLERVWSPAVRSASDIPCGHVQQKTRPLSRRAIARLVEQFVRAAYRARQAGFDGVEIHAAHGYLIQQFLSPRTNRRRDEYGGTPENRFRFLGEIIRGVKAACGADFPVSVRISVDEFYSKESGVRQGITLGDGVDICRRAEAAGADALNVTSATYETMNDWLEPVTYKPGWRRYLAAEVKKAVSLPVIAANLIRSPRQAEEQLAGEIQDFAGFGRPFLADPFWPQKAREGREDEIRSCINCLHCFESLNQRAWAALPLECARNPFLGAEGEAEKVSMAGGGRRALIIGAGPAGLTAAALLGRNGYAVRIVEAASAPGGQVRLAARPPGKERIADSVVEMEREARRRGARISYDTRADRELVKRENPDLIVYAAGSKPLRPPIPGLEGGNVFSVDDVLSQKAVMRDKKVIVAGSGLTGLETAEYLAASGNAVSVVEMAAEIAPGAYHQNREDVMGRLLAHGAELLPGHRLERVFDNGVELTELKSGKRIRRDADALVLALGNRSERTLLEELQKEFEAIVVVGDADSPGKIAHAVQAGSAVLNHIL